MEIRAMKRFVTHISPAARVAILIATCGVIALMSGMGCTDRLKGELDANQKPYVNFVNVPPDLQRFSRNPVINWYGSDVDGVIAYFRYVVVLRADIDSLIVTDIDLNNWVMNDANVDSATGWTYLVVDPTGPDPQTSQVVKMTADLSDPIRQYVEQYVFLQAVDAEGAGSDVVHRLFSRNDHPPQTLIFGYGTTDTPFVNSVFPGGAISGVPISWTASDPIDYPQDPPPFEFNWRMYGPYTDAQFAVVKTFMDTVFLTRDAVVYRKGTLLTKCDTTIIGVDTTVDCDTVTVSTPNRARIAAIFGADYGVFERFFDVDAPTFTSLGLNRIVEQSQGVDGWTRSTSDTLFNVFRTIDSDTTQIQIFVLWAKSKDDAGVPDPVPAFLANGIPVVDPKFERHVLLLDYTGYVGSGRLSTALRPQVDTFWQTYINNWEEAAGLDSQFTISVDRVSKNQPRMISKLLQHKIVVIYNDCAIKGGLWDESRLYGPVLKAISGGVNCWSQMRCPVLGGRTSLPEAQPVPPLSALYTAFFGVVSPTPGEHYYHSGWEFYANGGRNGTDPKIRNESFKGGRPLPELADQWPALLIDTGLLHKNYDWTFRETNPITHEGPLQWIDTLACLPEVNWTPRLAPGTEPMYFFYSLYGNEVLGDSTNGKIIPQSHPLGPLYDHTFYPIAHQFDNGFFRTVHMDFTLPAIKRDANLDIAFNRIMNYLWDEDLNAVVAETRYPNAKAAWTADELKANWKRVQDQWNLDAGWIPKSTME
jgi:hypothetical protein